MDLEPAMRFKIEVLDYEDLKKLVDYEALNEFRNRSLNPERPYTKELLKTQISTSKQWKLQIHTTKT